MAGQQALPDDSSVTSGCSTEAAARSRIAPRRRRRFSKSAAGGPLTTIKSTGPRRVEYTWKQHRGVLCFTTVTPVTKLAGAFLNYDIKVI
jgi:hypothetical protein